MEKLINKDDRIFIAGHRGMAGSQILLSNLGVEHTDDEDSSQEKILSSFTKRMLNLFESGDDQ